MERESITKNGKSRIKFVVPKFFPKRLFYFSDKIITIVTKGKKRLVSNVQR